jgi:hypothetical protein
MRKGLWKNNGAHKGHRIDIWGFTLRVKEKIDRVKRAHDCMNMIFAKHITKNQNQ